MTCSTNPPQGKPLILATRGSTLALWQANYIKDLLYKEGVQTELSVIKTTGDIVQDRFLHEIGGKGLFIKELEEAMMRGHADLAMHSLKDLPVEIPQGFRLAAILKRHVATDAIIFRSDVYAQLNLSPGRVLGAEELKSLGPLKIATSSLRRRALLEELRSGIKCEAIRGNVDTRLRKLEDGANGWDALILAEASLERLGLKHLLSHRLDPKWFIPCAGQGALAVETPDPTPYANDIQKLHCWETGFCVTIERSILKALGGDCTMPFGCLVSKDDTKPDTLVGRVVVLDLEGRSTCAVHTKHLDQRFYARNTEYLQIVMTEFKNKLLNQLKERGVNDILARLKIEKRI